eukprot:contig_7671_g1798
MSVKKAPHAGFSEAIAAAANVLAGATDLPCSRSIPFPGDKAAFTTVATTTAMVVAQAVPQAVKLLAGVLVDDALKAGPPPAGDLPGDAAERKWLQAKAASKVAAALLAGAVKVRDAQWPQEFPVPVRALVHGAMSSVFERYKYIQMRPGKKRGAAPVLAMTLGEDKRTSCWQYFLPLLLEVQAALAARGVATIPILRRGHPPTCRYTAVTPSLLRTAIQAAGLACHGRWMAVHRGLGGTGPAKTNAVRALAHMAGMGTHKTAFRKSVLSDGTEIFFMDARPATAAETVAAATAHVRRRMGSKRPGGAAPSIESQEAAMALNLSDASVLVCKMGLDLCNNAVATAVSDRPHLLDFLFAACIDARRRAKAVLVACCPALRAAMALTPLAAAAVGDDVQQKAEV